MRETQEVYKFQKILQPPSPNYMMVAGEERTKDDLRYKKDVFDSDSNESNRAELTGGLHGQLGPSWESRKLEAWRKALLTEQDDLNELSRRRRRKRNVPEYLYAHRRLRPQGEDLKRNRYETGFWDDGNFDSDFFSSSLSSPSYQTTYSQVI